MKFAAALMMACARCAAPAAARPRGESVMMLVQAYPAEVPDDLSGINQARVVLMRYADCLIGHSALMVKRALAMYSEEEANKALARMSIDACLTTGLLRFQPRLLRGALFIELYRREFRHGAPALPATPIDFAADINMPRDYYGYSQFVSRRKFADCVVRANEGAAHTVVMATAATHSETEAFAALAPSMEHCLPAGERFQMDRLSLTSLLAEVLYRNAHSSLVPAEKK